MKWVIAYNWTKKTTIYLSKEFKPKINPKTGKIVQHYSFYPTITFSKLQRKIPPVLLFNTKQDAEDYLQTHINVIACMGSRMRYAPPMGYNLDKYFIDEYDETQFDFLKSRKSLKFELAEPKDNNQFCGCCGMQIKTKYFKSRMGKICPLCVLEWQESATNIINAELKKDPEFIKNYKVSRFINNV